MSGRDVLMGGRKIKGYAHLDECLWWSLLYENSTNKINWNIMTEVLYYLSNFINTPNIFTNSTKSRSKRFDTWFHRQVKSSQVPCASGCDGRELFREKVFLSRLTKLVPAWPTFSLFRSLHTFAHRSLFSSLERARDKLPLGNRRRTRCEREDGR